MTPRVLGLDLSIAATGYADTFAVGVTGVRNHIQTSVIATDPKNFGKGPYEQWRRLTCVALDVASRIGHGPNPDLVVIEGPSYGSKGNSLHQLGGLWWLIYDMLTRTNTPVAVIEPGRLKKYATGKGSATKPDMRMALYQRAGIDERNDNRCDAWWLAAAGLEHLGLPPVKLPAAQRTVLNDITWPASSLLFASTPNGAATRSDDPDTTTDRTGVLPS